MRSSLPSMFPEQSWDMLVPVPSSPRLFSKRLFHPCAVLADEVRLACPGAPRVRMVLRHALRRNPQSTLHHDARLRRLDELFSANARSVRGARILLVEDVITTGATTAAATLALLQAGAASVDVYAAARARVWPRFRGRIWQLLGAGDTVSI